MGNTWWGRMDTKYTRMSRNQVIESISQVAVINDWDRKLYMAIFSCQESLTDTDMAKYWFIYFGEVILVGDSRLHVIFKARQLKYQLITEQIIQNIMDNSRR